MIPNSAFAKPIKTIGMQIGWTKMELIKRWFYFNSSYGDFLPFKYI